MRRLLVTAVVAVALAPESRADDAAELARRLQNPLASIRALMTDNTIGFDTGADGATSFGFQLQPVYAIDFESRGFTLIPRAVIPIMGLEPGSRVRGAGEDGLPTPPGSSRVWGLGDSALQAFVAPHAQGKWSWGVGPQVSLQTRTDSDLAGPGWGAGFAAVVAGDLGPDLSFAALVGNLWSFDGGFNTGTFQPMLYYNLPALPGAYLAYNAAISANWEADGSDVWTVPLGLTLGRTFDMGEGNGLDVGVGPYYNVVRPDGAAGWLIRFGITWLFP